MRYQVELLEVNTRHEVSEVVNKPPFIIKPKDPDLGEADHQGCYQIVVMCFATPIQILTHDGLQIGQPGDCFVLAPTFSEYHMTAPGEKDGFVNDWTHLWVIDPPTFEMLDVPMNTLIHTGMPHFIRAELEMIREELMYRRESYEQMVSNTIEQMLIRIKRAHREQENPRSGSLYHARMLELRKNVAGKLAEAWSVSRMARMVNLSPSRFSVVYHEQFNASPLEDLILMRITAAKRLLQSTEFSLREIAVQCGFGNEYYFSRVFKNKTGIVPSAYRRR